MSAESTSASKEKSDLKCGEMLEGEHKQFDFIVNMKGYLGFPESHPTDILLQHCII